MDDGMLFFGTIIGVFLFWKFTASLRSETQETEFRERRSGYSAGTPFHAVSIHPEPNCCSAVRTVQSYRFLSEEAPGLPLPQCDQATCGCKYKHHSDRRSGARDRRYAEAKANELAEFWQLKNRRSTVGRRGGDLQGSDLQIA